MLPLFISLYFLFLNNHHVHTLLTGKFSSLPGVYRGNRWRRSRSVWWLVIYRFYRCIARCRRGLACCSFHQVRGCHSQNSGYNRCHFTIVRARLVAVGWTAHGNHGDCRCSSCNRHLQLHLRSHTARKDALAVAAAAATVPEGKSLSKDSDRPDPEIGMVERRTTNGDSSNNT